MAEVFEPIRIVEVVAAEVGKPRNDGTRGSALYSVPFRLSRSAPGEWARFFVQAWDYPESSAMGKHRPGICSVAGDRVVLNGTTLEEVGRYHKATLELAASAANEQYVALFARREQEEARRREQEEAHRRHVEEEAKKIKFD